MVNYQSNLETLRKVIFVNGQARRFYIYFFGECYTYISRVHYFTKSPQFFDCQNHDNLSTNNHLSIQESQGLQFRPK